jgi:hypothetical protein
MPAKKNTSVAAPMMPTPAQYQMPMQQYSQMPPMGYPQYPMMPQQYQMPMQMPPQYSMPVSAPVAASMPPMMAPIAPVSVPTGPSAIELMESQMKAMKEYLASMEKTFKEAKKSMKSTRTPKDPLAPKKPAPAGTKAWNDYVVLVQNEINATIKAVDPTSKGITRKQAMEEAKKMKAAGDPRYNYVKKVPEPKATTAATPAIAPTPLASMAPMTAAITAVEQEADLELEEVEIDGTQYLMSNKSECWLMEADGSQGAWAGVYDGKTIDDTVEEPEY